MVHPRGKLDGARDLEKQKSKRKKKKGKFIYQEGPPPITTIKKVTVRNERGRGNKQKTERGRKEW